MTCDEARLLIDEELDGAPVDEQIRALQAHLVECPACRRVRDQLRGVALAAADLRGAALDDGMWERMVSAAADRVAPARRRPVRLVAALAAAAALVALGYAAWHAWQPASPRAPALPPSPAVAEHRATVAPAPAHRSVVSVGARTGPRPPRHAAPSRAPRRHARAGQPATVKPADRAPVPPVVQLTPEDVCLIYETALTFARNDGRSGVPADLISLARVRADSGDLPGAIAAYEAAVEASVRSPIPSRLAAQQSRPDPIVVQVPDPPAEVLVARLLGGQ